MDEPLLLTPGLVRLGARSATDGTLSWVPQDVRDPLPINVYLLRTDDHALVLDTGPGGFYPELGAQIAELVGDRTLSVLVTRNDPEAMGGVGTLLPQLRPDVFYYYGGGSILEWVWDERGGPGAAGDLFDTVPVASPPVIELGPDRRLVVLRPPLAVLNTIWLWDESTATLFTSDGLGYLPTEPVGEIVDTAGTVDGRRAKAFIEARFDWIERLNSTRLVDELHELLDPLAIEILAPSHGVVVSGRTAVERYLGTVLDELTPKSTTSPGRSAG
jgi:flavorubredoxin